MRVSRPRGWFSDNRHFTYLSECCSNRELARWMITRALDRIEPGNPPEPERSHPRHCVWCCAVKMAGDLACREKTGNRALLAKHTCLDIGGHAAERIDNRPHKRKSEERRSVERTRP